MASPLSFMAAYSALGALTAALSAELVMRESRDEQLARSKGVAGLKLGSFYKTARSAGGLLLATAALPI